MSVFGNGTFKQEVYDSLHYIINNFEPVVTNEVEQLKFLQETILLLLNEELSKVNTFIMDYAKKRNMTTHQVCRDLTEVSRILIEHDIVLKKEDSLIL